MPSSVVVKRARSAALRTRAAAPLFKSVVLTVPLAATKRRLAVGQPPRSRCNDPQIGTCELSAEDSLFRREALYRLNLNARTGHVTAFFGALPARLGAPLAVFDLMLLALGPAGVTNIGALAAKIMGELRPSAHPFDGPGADVRAVSVESDTFGHFLHVLLIETSRGTMLAFLGTLDAGCDAGLKLLMGHRTTLLCKREFDSAHRRRQ